ncbi:MAG: DUF2220 family protein [Evtepia sp.]
MNDAMSQKLIHALLDKYERSSSFRNETPPTKRILLKLYDNGQCEFKDYDIEQSEIRIELNHSVSVLAEKGLISFVWMKGEENHILSKVWLNYERLSDVYRYVNRLPKKDIMESIGDEIHGVLQHIKTEWMQNYLQDAYRSISINHKPGNILPEDESERLALLQALQYIDACDDSELLERVFSIRCFGDSKCFERLVKSRLLRILKQYLDTDDTTTDEQLLHQIGIVKYPEPFEFCGNARLLFAHGNCVDFSQLHSGSVVFGQDLQHAQFCLSKEITTILSIENKANYIDYISKKKCDNEFVIYHGGQYSPSKRKFFQTVSDPAENCTWYHWGDIDYGGFSMLARLRREINSDIKPYRMNKKELTQYSTFTAPITPAYSQKLQHIMQYPELEDCSECLNYMTAHKIRLEQEAMLE